MLKQALPQYFTLSKYNIDVLRNHDLKFDNVTLDQILDKKSIRNYFYQIQQEREQTALYKRNEFIFLGRSNVGKSSLLNSIIGKQIAEVSNYPGKTRNLFVFKISKSNYIIDSPGYGFAKGDKKELEDWGSMMQSYLKYTEFLRQAFVLIDSEHGYKETDKMIVDLLESHKRPYTLCFTKSDKIKEYKQLKEQTLLNFKDKQFINQLCLLTSIRDQSGINMLKGIISFQIANNL
ncbi:hypothetical protein pb186bvf_005614 [Paramecium bursaria]